MLPRLTSLRWYAALLVFAYHAYPFTHWGPLHALNDFGPTGVTFFFVLSGFVLAWSTSAETPARTFYRRRFARIYPACLVSLLATAGALELRPAIGLRTGAVTFVACLLLLQAWAPGALSGFDLPQWSLSVEMFFYACFPWLNRRLRALAPGVRDRLALLALVVAAGASLEANMHGQADIVYSDPVVRMAEFVLGMVLAMRVQAGWRPRIPIGAAVALVVGAFAICDVPLMQDAFPMEDYIVVLPVALLVVAAAVADLDKRPGVLTRRWATYLGQVSFCFYLVHYPVLAALQSGLGWHSASSLGAMRMAIAFAVTLALSVALHQLVELPFQRRLNGRPTGTVRITETALGQHFGQQQLANPGARRSQVTRKEHVMASFAHRRSEAATR